MTKNEILLDFLLSWPIRQKSRWSDLWMIGPSMIFWHIWKEINRRIFKETSLSNIMLIDKIKGAIEEVTNGKILNSGPKKYNNWDSQMEKHWSLKRLDNFAPPLKSVDRKSVRWKAPPKDWTKLNFD